MKSINSSINKVKDLDNKLKDAYLKALKNDSFKQLVSGINLSDEKLMKHTSNLEDAATEYENCKNCKGLAMCKNAVNGYCFLPTVDNYDISFSYVSCKYKNKLIKETKYEKYVTSIDVPKEIKEAKIKDIYTFDNARKDVIKWILNYVKDYKNKKIKKGLFLHGNFGCGKTYLVAALFNELAKDKVKSVIVYFPEYLRSLKASYGSSSSDEFKEKYNEVKYAKLLLIDDLGAEVVTAWSRDEILGSILQYRMQEGLPTFITSNLNAKELEEHLSLTSTNKLEKVKAVRIMERIKQLTIDMEMIGENNRK